jgi:hypothetical protein
MGETLGTDSGAMSQAFIGPTQFRWDMQHIQTTRVFAFDALEHSPDTFLRLPFWRTSRQAFKRKSLGTAFYESSLIFLGEEVSPATGKEGLGKRDLVV